MPRAAIPWLIREAVENMAPDFDLTPLMEACRDSANLAQFRDSLWALHHVARPIISDTFLDEGDVLAGSLATFLLAVAAEPIIDDPRSILDFPRIKLHSKWVYDVHLAVPISRLTQAVAVSMLIGLDWLLFCDIFREDNSEEFHAQARELFFLIQNRIFYLINGNILDVDILDMEDYRDAVERVIMEAADTLEYDYASDEDMFNTGVLLNKESGERVAFRGAHVNLDFVYDMESLICHFHTELYKTDNTSPRNITELARLSAFRHRLKTKVCTVDHKWLIRERMDWQHSLQTHEGQERVFRHHHGLNLRRVRPRQIIVTINDELVTQGEVSSFEDMMERQTGSPTYVAVMLRLSTDAMFWVWSEQTSKLLRKLLPRFLRHNALLNAWLVALPEEEVLVPSMTHGFCELRKAAGPTGMLYDIDLRAFDELLDTL